ncbi:DNA/RNA non-specific endonuclease [Spirosoma pulveris]
MCPSNDRNNINFGNQTTFILSNVVPQAPLLNNKSWWLL